MVLRHHAGLVINKRCDFWHFSLLRLCVGVDMSACVSVCVSVSSLFGIASWARQTVGEALEHRNWKEMSASCDS